MEKTAAEFCRRKIRCDSIHLDQLLSALKTLPEGRSHRTDFELIFHRESPNLYGMQMARAPYEGALAERPFVICRAGYAGLQRYAICWRGDNSSSREHLADSVQMLLSFDEVRSAACLRLAFENQRPLQTFVRPGVQPGLAFTVLPTQATVPGGKSATFIAQAGERRKPIGQSCAMGRRPLWHWIGLRSRSTRAA